MSRCHAQDPDLEAAEQYTCTEDADHTGDHVTTDGEGGKVLACWPNNSLRRITDGEAMTRLMTKWSEHVDDWNGADAVDFIADLLILTGRIDSTFHPAGELSHLLTEQGASMDDLSTFLQTYAGTTNPLPQRVGDGPRVVLDLALKEGDSPFIILRYGKFELILNPMALSDHLCVDAHAFIDGATARTSAFGMEDGRRGALNFQPGSTPGLSHGWPAAQLMTLLLGRQR